MKKTIAILLSISLVLFMSLALAEDAYDFSFVDSMDIEQITALRDYCSDKIQAAKATAISDGESVEATRENPALIGDRVILDLDNTSLAITVEYAYQGTSANMFAKSFDRYNTSSYSMSKGTEWVLVYLKIEALNSNDDLIDLSDYYFHIISDSGVDKGYSYISDNPLPINSMYTGATQYCWFGLIVDKDEPVLLTYSDGYNGSYWFSTSVRRQVDTSNVDYPEIKKNSTGETVEAVQMRLVEYGYLERLPNGKFDSYTISALKKFQKATDIKADGAANNETLRRLFSGAPITE